MVENIVKIRHSHAFGNPGFVLLQIPAFAGMTGVCGWVAILFWTEMICYIKKRMAQIGHQAKKVRISSLFVW
jgi:hypothetical protein